MSSRRSILIPFFVGVVGLVVTMRVPLASGFSRVHPDEGDPRHQNYVLEHVYRWITGDPLHDDLWSPPTFYPARNTGPYSEMLLGVSPLYVLWRLAGVSPEASLQLTILLALALDFVGAYVLFRSLFRAGPGGASAGAFLFAFGFYRASHLGHVLLLGQFFTPVALVALGKAFREPPETDSPCTNGWIALFFASLVAQLYAGMHLGWFLGFGLGVAAVVALALPETRVALAGLVRRRWVTIASCAVVSGLLALPLVSHHLAASREAGVRSPELVARLLLPLKTWLNPGTHGVVYGSWLGEWHVFTDLFVSWEKVLFPGFITGTLIVIGLRSSRRSRPLFLAVATGAVLVLLTTSWPGGHSLWRLVYETVPGASGIRAVGRVVLVLLIPMGALLAVSVDQLLARGKALAVAAVLLLAGFEQVQALPWYEIGPVRERVARVVREIPPGCRAFFYSPIRSPQPHWVTQLDAMWASLEAGIPTVNGYSSNFPPKWEPLMAHAAREAHETRLRANLETWLKSRGLPAESVCFVEIPAAALPATTAAGRVEPEESPQRK